MHKHAILSVILCKRLIWEKNDKHTCGTNNYLRCCIQMFLSIHYSVFFCFLLFLGHINGRRFLISENILNVIYILLYVSQFFNS